MNFESPRGFPSCTRQFHGGVDLVNFGKRVWWNVSRHVQRNRRPVRRAFPYQGPDQHARELGRKIDCYRHDRVVSDRHLFLALVPARLARLHCRGPLAKIPFESQSTPSHRVLNNKRLSLKLQRSPLCGTMGDGAYGRARIWCERGQSDPSIRNRYFPGNSSV